jgi:hypothetical protein
MPFPQDPSFIVTLDYRVKRTTIHNVIDSGGQILESPGYTYFRQVLVFDCPKDKISDQISYYFPADQDTDYVFDGVSDFRPTDKNGMLGYFSFTISGHKLDGA